MAASHSLRPGPLGSAPPSWPIWTHPSPSMGPTVAPTLSALTCFPSAGSALPTYTFLQEALPDHAGRTASHSSRWQLPFSWCSPQPHRGAGNNDSKGVSVRVSPSARLGLLTGLGFPKQPRGYQLPNPTPEKPLSPHFTEGETGMTARSPTARESCSRDYPEPGCGAELETMALLHLWGVCPWRPPHHGHRDASQTCPAHVLAHPALSEGLP